VGIKYCGGCNAFFDRSNFMARFINDLPNVKLTDSHDDLDYALIICGCPRACVSHKQLTGRFGKSIVTKEADYEWLVSSVQAVAQIR
jgi:4-hydroxybutyrate CoA-transferase